MDLIECLFKEFDVSLYHHDPLEISQSEVELYINLAVSMDL